MVICPVRRCRYLWLSTDLDLGCFGSVLSKIFPMDRLNTSSIISLGRALLSLICRVITMFSKSLLIKWPKNDFHYIKPWRWYLIISMPLNDYVNHSGFQRLKVKHFMSVVRMTTTPSGWWSIHRVSATHSVNLLILHLHQSQRLYASLFDRLFPLVSALLSCQVFCPLAPSSSASSSLEGGSEVCTALWSLEDFDYGARHEGKKPQIHVVGQPLASCCQS